MKTLMQTVLFFVKKFYKIELFNLFVLMFLYNLYSLFFDLSNYFIFFLKKTFIFKQIVFFSKKTCIFRNYVVIIILTINKNKNGCTNLF